MKNTILTLIILLAINLLSADLAIVETQVGLELDYTNDDLNDGNGEINLILALPATNVEINVSTCAISEIDENGEVVEIRNSRGTEQVKLLESFVMRELYGHSIKIDLKVESGRANEVISQISFEVRSLDQVEIPGTISMVFDPVYRQMVANYEQSYLRDAELVTPSMLVITPPQIQNTIQPFVDWKNERGIATQVATLDETGSTAPQIRNYIQNIYDTSDNPPDYVVLFGDADEGFFVVPSFFINSTGEIDVTDHPYVMLQGDDYFPEMLVGRISIDTITELQRIITKILVYEKEPYMESNWFENSLLVAGNYASSPPIPTTPVAVSEWLRDKMYDHGYNQVHEVYYPPTNDGTTAINNAFNSGVGFVSYRGWGDANGWHKPEYHTGDMGNLNNGYQLPIMTSIVCNTGDFVNSVDPCFGEAMLRAHVGSTPRGAVAVVAPSDLHTSTKYNNSIFSGFYSGVLDEDIFSFGAAVLRGKIELYNNFPLERNPGGYVEFYYHVYNILGDPSIQMWTKTPQEITLGEELPQQIGLGTNYLEVFLPGMDGAVVSAVQGNEMSATISTSGSAVLMLPALEPGDLKITVTKPNYQPRSEIINVVQNNVDIGITEFSFSSDPIAGTTVNLSVTLTNYGTEISSAVNATLTTDNEYININTASVNYGSIAPAISVTDDFNLSFDANCPDGEMIDLNLDLGGYGNGKIGFFVNSMLFDVTDVIIDDDGIASPGETVEIEVTLLNSGSVDAVDLQAVVVALSDAVAVLDQQIEFGSVPVNGETSGSFTIQVDPSCLVGRTVSFQLDLSESNGRETQNIVAIEIGEIDNTHPTFSASMDYFAYDSFDIEYDETPDYNWYEIDPQAGGAGSVTYMPDDFSASYQLPFTFRYYGIDYDSLTICSNGWISFETTWMVMFSNWTIPAPLGPYAMVAPYWDDLIGEPFMVGDSLYHHDMRICRHYEESENIFIVEWNECVSRFDDSTQIKFQVILYDPDHYPTIDGNGEIQFNYHTVDNVDANNNYATVGIENQTQQKGVLYTYADIYPPSATPLQNEMAIKFTTDPPDNFTESDNLTLIPQLPVLHPNYPNPFNPVTTISFTLPTQAEVELSIYNVKGQLVNTLAENNFAAGTYDLIWNGRDNFGNSVTSGIYYYKLNADNNIETRKCVLIK
ncbi:MAG: hypothetical protein APR54_00620 [Candidatus Cloacimonas sp. SDB]|nr:MAG: hypothetical protein APR54_00620 [Candidatus Cloacimonas sp. SDB]